MSSYRSVLLVLAGLSLCQAQVPVYGQCGGSGYTGSTECASGSVCSSYNAFYYQCVPSTATGGTATTSSQSLVTTSSSVSSATSKTSSTAVSKTSSTASGSASSTSGTKYLMVFGDSYSTTGSWIGSDKPSSSNPIGNPSLPGTTTSGGLNWVGQTVSKLNTSIVLAYDFAVSGAVTDSAIVDGYASYNFDDQVDLFQTYLSSKPDYAPWTSSNTLVAVWIGINDVGESFWDYKATPLDAVMDRYFGLLQTLYNDGVTKFALFTIPPFDQAPVMIGQTTDRLNSLRSNITAYNTALGTRLTAFKSSNSGVAAQVFNTTPSFETVFKNPTSYGASSDLTCYNSDGTSCVWYDNYHPGQAIQKLVAQAFVSAFTGSFF